MNDADRSQLSFLGNEAASAAESDYNLTRAVLHRLADVAPAVEKANSFRDWHDMTFPTLRASINKRFKTDFPVAERDEWECWYEARRAEAAALRTRVADAEVEINERVYAVYGLNQDAIAGIENALEGQY